MELDVSRALLVPGTELPFSAVETVPPQDVIGETVTFEPAMVRGAYSALDGVVRLTGELTTTAHATCALCMEPANVPLAVPFDEEFRKDVNELEDEAFRYEGNHVPLNQLALTLIMLNLPMRFLCKQNCAGSKVYQALRQNNPKSSCEEEEPRTQRPFEALQRLLKEDEEV
jgi:uncharacterized protein